MNGLFDEIYDELLGEDSALESASDLIGDQYGSDGPSYPSGSGYSKTPVYGPTSPTGAGVIPGSTGGMSPMIMIAGAAILLLMLTKKK